MKNLLEKLYNNSIVRYVFFGGCTTLVNLASFYLLRKAGVELNTANIISIILAVLFAYVVNSRYVFMERPETLAGHVRPFVKFVGARLATMIIEVVSVWFFAEVLHTGDMTGKFVTQFVVIVLNYVFSRWFVFTGNKTGDKK